jgi:hypothetical protein
MARAYIASPVSAAGAITEVATGTGLKTLLQVGVPANSEIKVAAWGVSFDGISGADAPGMCYLGHGDVAATGGTSQTPTAWQDSIETLASLCVGGTGATGYNFGTEGTITSFNLLDGQEVHPQSGYTCWFPSDYRPRIGSTAARYLRLRAQFAVTVNCIPWIIWQE